MMVQKVGFSSVVAGASAGTLSDEQIKSYFEFDAARTRPFDPRFRVNVDAVDVSGMERTAAVAGNALAIEAGQNRLRANGPQPAGNGTYVAEGDSWFKLPGILFPRTMADFLADRYPLDNLAHWGDTISDMVAKRQYLRYLEAGTVKYLLFSGGGNDLLGETLEQNLKIYDVGHNKPDDAEWYLTEAFYDGLNGVMNTYAVLIDQVRKASPSTKLVVHGYDYARPEENGIFLGIHFMKRGLHPIEHPQLCLNIVRVMIDKFNQRLAAVAKQNASFKYVDLRNTVRDDEWYDSELHPKESAAKRLADKMAAVLGPRDMLVAETRSGRRKAAA